MSIFEACILAVVGFLVVAVELSLLALIIIIMSKIIRIMTDKKQSAEIQDAIPQSNPAPVVPAGMAVLPQTQSAGSLDLHDVDDKTAAMLMAIVSDETGISLNELRFQSIRSLD